MEEVAPTPQPLKKEIKQANFEIIEIKKNLYIETLEISELSDQ